MSPRARPVTARSVATILSIRREGERAGHFLALCVASGLPIPERQFQFAAPDRKWAADFAWPEHRVALEVEGGVWSGGKHGRGSGILKDMEKQNGYAVRGWRVLRVTPSQLCTTATTTLVMSTLWPTP